MYTLKTIKGVSFMVSYTSLGEAQKLRTKNRREMHYTHPLKDEFIGSMWQDPEERRKSLEKK